MRMRESDVAGVNPESVPSRPQTSWDVGLLSQALGQAPDPCVDVAHGPGVRYGLANGAVTVELFPPVAERPSGVVRICTADTRHELFRQSEPAVRTDGLIFHAQGHVLTVTAGGSLAYQYVSPEPPTRPVDAPTASEGLNLHGEVRADVSGDPVPFQGDAQDDRASPQGQRRVKFAGRLGTEPRTKQTPKGRLVMEFPVAVAIAGQEKPEWRQTVVFDAKARALDGVLHKGTAVEVIAYEHHKTKSDPATGRRRDVREYYATTVTPKLRAGESASEAPGDPRS